MKSTPTQPSSTTQSTPSLPYTIVSNLSLYRQRIGVIRIFLALLLIGFLFFRFGPFLGVIGVAGIGVILGGLLLSVKLRKFSVTAEGIEYRNIYGAVRKINYNDIDGVKIFANYLDPSFGTYPRLVIGVKNAAPLILSALYWNLEDIETVAGVLDNKKVTLELYDQPANSSMIVQEFPSYTSYIERHPIKVAMIITGIIFVAVFVIVAFITPNL